MAETRTSEIHYALYPSWRREYKTVGSGVNARYGRFRVGFDVFRITGHTVIGDKVYLTLEADGWVRDLKNLATRQPTQETGNG